MKRVCRPLLAAGIVALLFAAVRTAPAAPFPVPPAPTAWVTDTAGFLSEAARVTQDKRLEAFEHASGHQVLVWVGQTTGDTPTEEWTVRAFQAWRIGRKGIDDGLVLFILAGDRKARIEVGYGLEERVPDAAASRILNEVVIPRIKAGDRDGAVTSGVDQLIAAIGGQSAPTVEPSFPALGLPQWIFIGAVGLVVIVLMVRYPPLASFVLNLLASAFFSNMGSGKNGGGRGGFGGGQGGRSGGGGATGRW